jgi:hypothetical protein
MIDDTATHPSDHIVDLVCECGHTHIEHKRGYSYCLAEDYECGCSRFKLASNNAPQRSECVCPFGTILEDCPEHGYMVSE